MPGFFEVVKWLPAPVPATGNHGGSLHYKSFDEVYGQPVSTNHVPSLSIPQKTKEGRAGCAKYLITCCECSKPRILYVDQPNVTLGMERNNTTKAFILLGAIQSLKTFVCGMSCDQLLDLPKESISSIMKTSFPDVACSADIKAMLANLRQKLKFSPNMFCHTPVENCYYTQSAHFPISLSERDRRICPVCGSSGRTPSAQPGDSSYTHYVRTCDNCIRENPSCIKAVKGNKKKRRRVGSAVEAPDEDAPDEP